MVSGMATIGFLVGERCNAHCLSQVPAETCLRVRTDNDADHQLY